jgi:hypothetical protein
MPRFPLQDQLALPATLERFAPGRLHPDGRRYLPLLLFRLASGALLGVVDRHHRVGPALEGCSGSARLVFLLSAIALQGDERRRGLDPGPAPDGQASLAPDIFGQVLAVPSWETDDRAGVETLYTELLLDIGLGVVGLRTGSSAPSVRESLGKQRIEPGDWLYVRRSRIDILEFLPDEAPGARR